MLKHVYAIVVLCTCMSLQAMEELLLMQESQTNRRKLLEDFWQTDKCLVDFKDLEQKKRELLEDVRKEIRKLIKCYSNMDRFGEFDIQRDGIEVQSRGETLLNAALYLQCYDLAKLAIRAGAKVNQSNNIGSDTPLMIATCGAPCGIVKLLLHEQAKIKDVNGQGHTPISLALMHYYFLRWPSDKSKPNLEKVDNQRKIIELITDSNPHELVTALDILTTNRHLAVFEILKIKFALWDIFTSPPYPDLKDEASVLDNQLDTQGTRSNKKRRAQLERKCASKKNKDSLE